MCSSYREAIGKVRPTLGVVRTLMALAVLSSGLGLSQTARANPTQDIGNAAHGPDTRLERADGSTKPTSTDVRQVADWIARSNDNQGLPYMIVDKQAAQLFIFDSGGTIRATSPVLLGLARGDDSPPGIGNQKLSMIAPEQRITPAGRFVAAIGKNLSGEDILWIDYDAAVSLHRLGDPKPGLTARNRQARLASATISDNRISHGCINVSAKFFETVGATFAQAGGIVYVLPETRAVQAVFPVSAQAIH